MYTARVAHMGTGKVTVRTTPSADNAARQLLVLLRADGYQGETDHTVRTLTAGVAIRHKSFEYSVQEGA